MNNLRIIYYRFFFWLPTVMAVAAFVIALLVWVLPWNANEPRRVGREYREMVEDFMEHPDRASFVGKRQRGSGWRQSGKINGIAYGHVREGKDELIWFEREDGECFAMTVKPITPLPIIPIYCAVGGALVAVFVLLSFFADYFCHRFQQERVDFLAAIAHDLTTPLAAMKISMGVDNDSATVLCDRLMRIVDNIKSFLRLDASQLPREAKPFNLLSAYKEAYELFRLEYRDLFAGEDIPVDCRVDTSVVGNMTMAVQILWNLLGNDLKYAAPYGKVRVKFSTVKGRVNFELIDEGPGMETHQMRRAFNRYFRGDSARQMGIGGFGIGLHTSREMARLMGGDITIQANNPHGCIFIFSMPSSTQIHQSMI